MVVLGVHSAPGPLHIGNVVKTIDARGAVTTTEYDEANRPSEIIAPDPDTGLAAGPRTRMFYDFNGNVVRLVDAEGNASFTEYDFFNRPIKVTRADGSVTETEYNLNGDPLSVMFNGKEMSRYKYDAFGRQTEEAKIDGMIVNTCYHVGGTVDCIMRPEGGHIFHEYDGLGRMTLWRTEQDRRSYVYDRVGNVLELHETRRHDNGSIYPYRVTTFTYDSLYRVVAEAQAHVYDWWPEAAVSYTVTSNYDANGNRTGVVYPGGRSLGSAYDNADRLETVTDIAHAGADPEETVYTYDMNGNRLSCTYPNGTENTYEYDHLNRVVVAVTEDADESDVYLVSYTYDQVGNRLSAVEQTAGTDILSPYHRELSWGYDKVYQLKYERWDGHVYTYDYDKYGNRTRMVNNDLVTDYIYDCSDPTQLSSWTRSDGKAATYGYDFRGNRAVKWVELHGQPQDVTTYHYDAIDRLVEVKVGATWQSRSTVFEAVYDYRTRRTWKKEGANETVFLYDGGVNFSETRYDEGVPVETVFFTRGSGMGGGIGSILYTDRTGSLKDDGREYFVYNPAVGHVVATIKEDADLGTVVKTANVYEAFGNILQPTEDRSAGFLAEYFTNTDFLGHPVLVQIEQSVNRVEDPINHPDLAWPDEVKGPQPFVAVWTGQVHVPVDGVLWVRTTGDNKLFDLQGEWETNGGMVDYLPSNTTISLAVAYRWTGDGEPSIKLDWLLPNGEIEHVTEVGQSGQFVVEYYLSDEIGTVPNYAAAVDVIHYDSAGDWPREVWPPAPGPVAPFSARWSGTVTLDAKEAGDYEFQVTAAGDWKLWIGDDPYYGGEVWLAASSHSVQLDFVWDGLTSGEPFVSLEWRKVETPELTYALLNASHQSGTKWVDVRALETPEKNTDGESPNNRLANTKERDFSIGLDNHGFRYYDPEVGRYLTRDPISYASGTLNVYAYVNNNPINRIDPLGLNEEEAKLRKKAEEGKAAYDAAQGRDRESSQRLDQARQALDKAMGESKDEETISRLRHNVEGAERDLQDRRAETSSARDAYLGAKRDLHSYLLKQETERAKDIPYMEWQGFADSWTDMSESFVGTWASILGLSDKSIRSHYEKSPLGQAEGTSVEIPTKVAFATATAATTVAAGVVASGYSSIVALHGPHHTFGSYGKLSHMQVVLWKAGVKGSQIIRRLPLPF